ncbi:lytic transglycosylase domain-containing protein (plasmid) [Pseudoduganella sp. UC29_106]|uniref:lytic transglycosylase domain-containing protein n=1 Tax=Pseudoduganella sp. UC29_106 TaxID=3374553 RepID=UPI0037581895
MISAEFIELAQRCAPEVHYVTLARLARNESSFNPYAIALSSRDKLQRQPKTKEEAIATAKELEKRGYRFAGGVLQVHSQHFKSKGVTFDKLFDTCANMTYAQTIFMDCFDADPGQGALPMQMRLKRAASCYATGNYIDGFKNGYVRKFLAPI